MSTYRRDTRLDTGGPTSGERAKVGSVALLAALAALAVLFAVLTVEASEPGPDGLDIAVLRWVLAHRDGLPAVTAFFHLVTGLGDARRAIPLCALVVAWLLIRPRGDPPRRRLQRVGAWVVVLAGGSLLTYLMKLAVGRERPPRFNHLVAVGEDSFSFPSGHAAFGALFFGSLSFLLARRLPPRWARLRPLVVAGGFLGAFLIGVSRVWLTVHYPSDVVGGLALGLFWVLAAELLEDRLRLDRASEPPLDAGGSPTLR